MQEEKTLMEFETYLYGVKGNKEGFLKIPIERYELTNERLKINKQGVMTETKSDIELYSIKDVTVIQKLKDKFMDIGNIEIISSDASTPKVVLKRIKAPNDIRETIRRAVKKARETAGVTYRVDL